MNKITLIILLSIILSSFSSFGQMDDKFKVTVGKKKKVLKLALSKYSSPIDFVLADKRGLYIFEYKAPFTVNHFTSSTMDFKQSTTLKIGLKRRLNQCVNIGGNFCVLKIGVEKGKKCLFVEKLNKSTLDPTREKIIKSMPVSKQVLGINFHTAVSKDNSKLAVITHYPSEDKNSDLKQIHIDVYDSDFKLLWSKTSNELVRLIPRIEVTNDGEVFLLYHYKNKLGNVNVMTKGSESVSNTPFDQKLWYRNAVNRNIIVLMYSKDRKDSLSTELPHPNQLSDQSFFNSLNIDLNDNNVIECNALCLPKSKNSYGIYHVKLDGESGAILTKKFHPLKEEFIQKNLSYSIVEMLKTTTGELLWVIESSKFVSGTVTADIVKNVSTSANTVVCKTDKEGNLLWSKSIYKRQVFTNVTLGYINSAVMLANDNLYLFINDKAENVADNSKNPAPLRNPKKGSSTMIKLDKDGNITKSLLFKDTKKAPIIDTSIYSVKEDNIYIYTIRGKFLRVSFQ